MKTTFFLILTAFLALLAFQTQAETITRCNQDQQWQQAPSPPNNANETQDVPLGIIPKGLDAVMERMGSNKEKSDSFSRVTSKGQNPYKRKGQGRRCPRN